jgi:hypothetical protein
MNTANDRLRQARGAAIAAILAAKREGRVSGFKPLITDNACEVCQSAREAYFPIGMCTAKMLPPYENCVLPGGCESTFVEVVVVDIPGMAKPSGWSRLKVPTLVIILVLTLVLWKSLF